MFTKVGYSSSFKIPPAAADRRGRRRSSPFVSCGRYRVISCHEGEKRKERKRFESFRSEKGYLMISLS